MEKEIDHPVCLIATLTRRAYRTYLMGPTEKVKASVRIEGIVQGVLFRYSTQQKARELGVNGWVRNLRDGGVECLLEGDRDAVEALIRWCHHGPSGAHVENVTTHWEKCIGDLRGFSIKY